jgi:HSP20 family protein
MFNKIIGGYIMMPMKRGQNWLPYVFNDLFDNNWMIKANSTAPAINVIESEKEYRVEVAAPGMTKDDFKIRIDENDNLVVCMEKREEKNEDKKEGRFLRREFSYSKFQQTIVLPDNVEADKIEAKMEHGVLNISIPKDKKEEMKRTEKVIEIK